MNKKNNSGLVIEVSLLGIITISLMALFVIAIFTGYIGKGGKDTIRFVFEENYMNRVSFSSFLNSKAKGYPHTYTKNLVASLAVSKDAELKDKINESLQAEFKNKKVSFSVAGYELQTNPDKGLTNHVNLYRQVPLTDNETEEISLWVYR